MFRITRLFTVAAALALSAPASALPGPAVPGPAVPDPAGFAVGPQYDTAHVYVPAAAFDRFVASFVATFGGTASRPALLQVTPTPSRTRSQLVWTPAGTVSVFGFVTPIPFPFGGERSGYLVTDLDAAVAGAVAAGATRLVAGFRDPIGRDAIVQWPGGVTMQFYRHDRPPAYRPLATIPENRVYLTADAADAFIAAWRAYAHGTIVADDRGRDGAEIGRPGQPIRRVAIASGYGGLLVFVGDGQWPWPYGRETTGYAVADLAGTLARARAAGAELLVPAHRAGGRTTAIVRFPGGYVAEIHAVAAR